MLHAYFVGQDHDKISNSVLMSSALLVAVDLQNTHESSTNTTDDEEESHDLHRPQGRSSSLFFDL